MNIYKVTIDREEMSFERYAAIARIIKSSGSLDERGNGFYFSKNGLEEVRGIKNQPGVELRIWSEGASKPRLVFAGR